ncbi:choice-of-anchor L domain-containing protein [Chryseobacterium wangxinyae]|uniref:choice-of-anchor L domain-containing protein n=1 Tax=unclassified Chryseobacterium TaxID=2593645 RepID=UPI00226FBD7E|nr:MULTISPECIES: choice-of-anchor L domain-containing protein [unclassified Chryseobacterium]MCY0968024.1 choice-of-anchor L domain-containing protein [Chryseobacterium sp. CY353]MCY0977559.1 choice-of-anchor L domain-containing protein [Chryseobacterium sp. CY350]WBZ95431.1 choice-of-anchor L domain-containing protein [Chryseobacterium sp. CY350]
MKRYLLLFLLFLVSTFSNAQTAKQKRIQSAKNSVPSSSAKAGDLIDVNVPPYPASNYTPSQLVIDVLVGTTSNCGTPNITNVTVSPNQPVTDTERFWGYFNKGTSNFPFAEGIVLTTGTARLAGNTPEGQLGVNLTTGTDPDLEAALVGSLLNLEDAVILEFDFVPTSTQMKFNYIFASEEYDGGFPCSGYEDAFALLLKPNTPGSTYTNLAVLPGGAGLVTATNIVPASFTCGPINAQYYETSSPTNQTNLYGRTVPLTASATVIPGQSYHIKMVMADDNDGTHDSAVFLEAGSFDIGVNLLDPSGAVLPAEINVCDSVPQVITASTSGPNLVYQWFLNGTLIPGANTNTITAIQPGTYKIEVSVPGNPCPGSASIKINGGTTPVAQDASFRLCSTPDITTFDLNSAKPLISPTPNAVFRFYEVQADAIAQNGNFIQAPANFNGTDGQILYVVVSDGGFCSKTVKLNLIREVTPIAGITSTRIRVCPGESVTLTATGGVTYLWDNFPGNGNTQTVTVQQTTTFTVYAIGAKGCKSLLPAKIVVETVPSITSPLMDVEMCIGDSMVLDAGAGNNYSYVWNTGAETQTITVNQLGIYSVVISNGICQEEFIVKVHGASSPFFTNLSYENNTLTAVATNPSINNIYGVLEYSIDDGAHWQDSNIFNNLTDNTTYNLLVRIKGTSCVGTIEFFTLEINNVITPNQDGVNDVLNLSGLTGFNNFTGSVYDRYGVEVFRFSKERPIWDGTVSGKRLPTATYWYKFNFEYNKSKVQMSRSGWIMLKNRE